METRDSYFYRMNRSAESTARGIVEDLTKMDPNLIVTIVATGDHWAPWPRDSYFWVKYRVEKKC